MNHLPVVAGIIALTASAAAWRGMWRGWTRTVVTAHLPVPLTILPALGTLLIALSIHEAGAFTGSAVLVGAALVAALLAPILAVWNPSWFGPAWYRELKASGKPIEPDLSDPLTAATDALTRSDVNGRTPVAKRFGESRPLARWRVSLLHHSTKVGGYLELHPVGIAFYPNHLEARMRSQPFAIMLRIEEVSAVRAARRSVTPSLEIHTSDGTVHHFEAFFPRRIERRIQAAQREDASGKAGQA